LTGAGAGTFDAGEEVLDITSGGEEAPAGTGDVFDISATQEGLDLDFTQGDAVTTPSDLLDVTRSGDVTAGDHGDLLNVTTPGPTGTEDEDVLDITTSQFGDTQGGADAAPEKLIEFDISDTVAPAFDSQDRDEPLVMPVEAAPLGEDVSGDEGALDFDIGGLATTDTDEAEDFGDDFDLALETTGDLEQMDADAAAAAASGSVDLDLTLDDAGAAKAAGEDLDLTVDGELSGTATVPEMSLQGSELDSIVAQAEATMSDLDAEADADADFDLSLEDTSELSELAIDETLELPRGDETDLSGFDADQTSLEDLTRSMEDTVSSLDGSGLDLDVSMDLDAALAAETNVPESTLVLPTDPDAEVQSDVDETDTKLNLAKAYIELGDRDGARSILDEVVREGSPAQQAEAESLRSQLS
jgi:pilus assembly protein FimV